MPVLSWSLIAKRNPHSAERRMIIAIAAHQSILADSRINQAKLPQHQPVPAPSETQSLLSSAHLTRPSEPILFPKVRICFADFPYLHCSKTKGYTPWRPAADMGTDLTGKYITPSDFQGTTRAHRTPQNPQCFTDATTLSRYNNHSRVYASYKEKRTLPGTPANVSELVCVTASSLFESDQFPWSGSGILTRFPFAPRGLTSS